MAPLVERDFETDLVPAAACGGQMNRCRQVIGRWSTCPSERELSLLSMVDVGGYFRGGASQIQSDGLFLPALTDRGNLWVMVKA